MANRTVLIVDDIAHVRKTLRDILDRDRYTVVGEAADGAEAIDLYRKLTPDIVTVDIVMPNVSGIEAIRRIMRMNKEARVVVISAMGQENLVMEAINVGARDYILKPFQANDVIKALDRAIWMDEKLSGKSGPKKEAV